MTHTDSWVSDPSLQWLSLLLSERFGVVFSLTKEEEFIVISYGQSEGSIRIRVAADTFSAQKLEGCAQWKAEKEGWSLLLGNSLPAPGLRKISSPIILEDGDGFIINYDILGLTFWMLTRREEIGDAERDSHGRFPASCSHAYLNGYLERPVVDEWLDILSQVIRRKWPFIELNINKFEMKVSHDVDSASRYCLKSIKEIAFLVGSDLLIRRDFRNAFYGSLAWALSKDEIHYLDSSNTYDWLMDLSESCGIKSAFYFMSGTTDSTMDADYRIDHPAIRKLLRHVYERGHEIGLHPSYNTYNDEEALIREADHLREICRKENIYQEHWGGRMHFLRWDQPSTLVAWDNAKLTYDSTLGYADQPGFRCGTCFEYPAFDPVLHKLLKLRIRPLVVMEGTVIGLRYLGLGLSDAAFEKIKNIKRSCKAVNGIFSLLWHNNLLFSPEYRDLYEKVLKC